MRFPQNRPDGRTAISVEEDKREKERERETVGFFFPLNCYLYLPHTHSK